jgi:hypothetical protein
MLVLGGQRTGKSTPFRSPVYVSHLPMFMSPHDFQVIVRVTGDAAGRYGDFVAHFGSEVIYTFEPEPFSIDELDPAGDGGPARTSFGGKLFRGHFERGGSEIAEDVPFEVEQVIHFRRFGGATAESPGNRLRYIWFGDGDAAFLAHLVTAPPDFDQVLSVKVGSLGTTSEEDLRDGVIVEVPDRPNDVEAKLDEGETFTGEVQAEAPAPVELTVESEYYLETGDLAKAM